MNEIKIIEAGMLNPVVSSQLAEFERQMKALKEQEDKLKQEILEAMETESIVKIDTEELTISYIAPTFRESLDSKKLRAKHPDLYDEFVRIAPVKASIRMKVKNNE